jgi:NodT family efflux transporter outer membrane factor (OMF) lipoprotein
MLALGGASLAACTVGPTYRKPDLALTAAFHTPTPSAPEGVAPADATAWWTAFGDPELVRVVERAVAQNLDLAQARARVMQSRAAARAAGAALLARGEADAGANRTEQSLQSPIGSLARHLPGYERTYDEASLGAGAAWEIDLFGGLQRGREAARAEARASLDTAQAVRLSIAAETADAYLQVRADQARLAVARRQAGVQRDLVDLLIQRTDQGVSPERELHESRAALENVSAAIPPLQAHLDAELNRLDVLMGAQPGTYRAELETPGPIPQPPALAVAEGPGGLLRRRPDVLAAEQRLVASNARIGEAVAGYYPQVSLSALIGVDSIDSNRLFAGGAVQNQIGAGLRWRLFDFGRVDAEVAAARGRDAEALAGYRATVLRAAEEAEDALSDLARQQARAQALAREVDQLGLARVQAEQAYEAGATSLIEVRDADRAWLDAADQLVLARAGAARAAVASFRALGGGWSPPVEARRLAAD